MLHTVFWFVSSQCGAHAQVLFGLLEGPACSGTVESMLLTAPSGHASQWEFTAVRQPLYNI